GKSDLALRAPAHGLRLVADDRVQVFVSRGRLYGKAPAALSGLIEARGVGILPKPSLALAEIVLAACPPPDGRSIERLAGAGERTILGVAVPRLEIRALEASAPAKLRLALEHLGAHRQQAYQARFAPPGGRAGA
ncbi:MAG: hypothetical protein H0X27_10250, partial [Caulobacteraceae bacterium]|nr:hypothetical protein [Caulobacteraceae bacterium]